MRRNKNSDSFLSDERAIEGLPIRLVIALVVGVAALALMMNLLSGFGSVGDTEVTVEFENEDDIVQEDQNLDGSVTMTVITEDGDPVEDARILLDPDTISGSPHETAQTTGADGQVNVDVSATGAELRPDQTRGEIDIEVIPPSGTDLVDEQDNGEIVVLSN